MLHTKTLHGSIENLAVSTCVQLSRIHRVMGSFSKKSKNKLKKSQGWKWRKNQAHPHVQFYQNELLLHANSTQYSFVQLFPKHQHTVHFIIYSMKVSSFINHPFISPPTPKEIKQTSNLYKPHKSLCDLPHNPPKKKKKK